MHSPFDPHGSHTVLVDRMIGTAYPHVRLVAQHMAQVKHLSFYMPQLYALSESIGNLDLIFDNIEIINGVYNNLDKLIVLDTNITELLSVHTNLAALLELNGDTTELFAARDTIEAFALSFGSVQAAIDATAADRIATGEDRIAANEDRDAIAQLKIEVEAAAEETSDGLIAFRGAWLGQQMLDPILDLNGEALTGGEAYVNGLTGRLRTYTTLNGWDDVGKSVESIPFNIVGDGTTGPYTLPEAPSLGSIVLLFIGGIWQSDFTVLIDKITTAVPVAADNSLSGVILNLIAGEAGENPGGGDMPRAVYDPQNLQADAFDRANHTGDNIPDDESVNDTKLSHELAVRLGVPFNSPTELIASTVPAQGVGTHWKAGDYTYEEAASDALDHHITNAAGVKLYILPCGDGDYNAKQAGATGAGLVDEGALLRAAFAAVPAGGRFVIPHGLYLCGLDANRSMLYNSQGANVHLAEGATLKIPDNHQTLQTTGEVITNQGPAKTLDDLTIGSNSAFSGTVAADIWIEIVGTGSPNTFRWKVGSAGTWSSAINITAANQAVTQGVTIKFGATTGHSSGSLWIICYDGPTAYGVRIPGGEGIKISGMGTFDFNRANNVNPSVMAIEIPAGVLIEGGSSTVVVEDLRFRNIAGRPTMTRAALGTTIDDVTVRNTKSRFCLGGHLGGHPEYKGTITNWRILGGMVVDIDGASGVEPNYNLTGFEVRDVLFLRCLATALHMWRGPREGVISNCRFEGTEGIADIHANNPGGWPYASGIVIENNRVRGSLATQMVRLEGQGIFSVKGNTGLDIDGYGFVFLADSVYANDNEVQACQREGFIFNGARTIAKNNLAFNCGLDGSTTAAIRANAAILVMMQGNSVLQTSGVGQRPNYAYEFTSTVTGGRAVNNTFDGPFNTAPVLNNATGTFSWVAGANYG